MLRLTTTVKTGVTIFLSLLLPFATTTESKLLIFAFVLAYAILNGVNLIKSINKLRSVFVFFGISLVLNLFYVDGYTVFKIGAISVTDLALKFAFSMFINMLTLTLIALVLLTINDQHDIAWLASALTRPLNIIGVKSHEISMMITLILHFIPIVFAETEKVILAQKARGARINEGNIIKRLKSFVPVLVPVFVSCIRKATKTSFAMEARCYGANPKRTSFRKFKIKKQDYFAIIAVIALAVGVFNLNLTKNLI